MPSVTRSASEWINDFAALVGQEVPSDEQREAILALAGTAAHASERTVAPVACWLAAAAGLSASEALAVARQMDPPSADGRDG